MTPRIVIWFPLVVFLLVVRSLPSLAQLPTGTVSGAAGVKWHTQKGVSLQAEAKAGIIPKIKGHWEHRIAHLDLED